MVVGGYKRIAVAALIARERSKREENKRLAKQRTLEVLACTPHTPDFNCHLSRSSRTVTPKKKTWNFENLSKKQQARLKSSEKWNAEKQQLENGIKKQHRRSEQRQRKRAKKKALQDEQHLRTEDTPETQNNGLPHKHVGGELPLGIQSFSSQVNGLLWKHVEEIANTSEDVHYGAGPTTPVKPARSADVLLITPSRRASPPLESIVSPTSSTLLKAAAHLLVALKGSTSNLNTQIASFTTHLDKAQRKLISIPETESHGLSVKVKVLKKIISILEHHSNEVLMIEYALRDVIDERDGDLAVTVWNTDVEFAEISKVHEGKMVELAKKLSAEAVEKAMKETSLEENAW